MGETWRYHSVTKCRRTEIYVSTLPQKFRYIRNDGSNIIIMLVGPQPLSVCTTAGHLYDRRRTKMRISHSAAVSVPFQITYTRNSVNVQAGLEGKIARIDRVNLLYIELKLVFALREK